MSVGLTRRHTLLAENGDRHCWIILPLHVVTNGVHPMLRIRRQNAVIIRKSSLVTASIVKRAFRNSATLQYTCEFAVILETAGRSQLNPMKTEIKWFGSAGQYAVIRQSCERGVRRRTTSVSGPRPRCPTGRRAEHASTRLQNDTNVLLPPPTTATGSTATWS